MAETATVFGPEVFPWSFYGHMKNIVKIVELNNSQIQNIIFTFKIPGKA